MCKREILDVFLNIVSLFLYMCAYVLCTVYTFLRNNWKQTYQFNLASAHIQDLQWKPVPPGSSVNLLKEMSFAK
jgi:hypothetical protein